MCIMKLGWKVYTNANDLWCQFLRNKYNIMDVQECTKTRATDSSLWNDITKTIPLMMNTGQWIVGDGNHIYVGEDNWMGKELHLNNFDVSILDDLRGAKVPELLNDSGEWNFSLINPWLLHQWISKLRSRASPIMDQNVDLFLQVLLMTLSRLNSCIKSWRKMMEILKMKTGQRSGRLLFPKDAELSYDS